MNRSRSPVLGLLLLSLGILIAAAVHLGLFLPVRWVMLLFAALAILSGIRVRTTELSLLPRFFILIYCLPFLVLLGYVVDSDFQWLFTPTAIRVASNEGVVPEMAMVGLVGLLGLAAGIFAAGRHEHTPRAAYIFSLDPLLFLLLSGAAILFSWMSAPPESILQAQYALGQSSSVSGRINFPAAYLVSYVLFSLLIVDTERSRGSERRLKLTLLAVSIGYVTLVLQFFRGDREVVGLLVALAAAVITYRLSSPNWTAQRRFSLRWMAFALVLAAFLLVLGSVRSSLNRLESLGVAVQEVQWDVIAIGQNPWTAILWTNLGLAWEHQKDLLEYKWGATYVDYLASLPPGVVSRQLGYERPLEAWRGVAWEDQAGVSAGGLHVVVVPFRNFGAIGVAFVLFVYGWIIAQLERGAYLQNWRLRVLWLAAFSSGFHWFWYGDMAMIRGMIAAAALIFAYTLFGPVGSGNRSLRVEA